jgi:hypothetical protein
VEYSTGRLGRHGVGVGFAEGTIGVEVKNALVVGEFSNVGSCKFVERCEALISRVKGALRGRREWCTHFSLCPAS